MKIGIVLHPYGEKQPGGLPRIIFGWASALISTHPEHEYIIYLKEKPARQPELPPGNWHTEVIGPGPFWLHNLRKASKADVYLLNTPILPLFYKPGPSVLITLDYPYKYLPHKDVKEKYWRMWMGWWHGNSMRRADHIIAVSNATKNDTVTFFNIPEEKISVVYHGYIDFSTVPETVVPLPPKYFFFAGTIKMRKNTLAIVQAFEAFKKEVSGYKLVFGGKSEGAYYESVLAYIREHGLESDIIWLGHLGESQLAYVYRRAEALLFPSIVEGTGFPILEAMSVGTPSVTSNIFGPAELGGTAAILVNPHDPHAIAEGMWRLAREPFLRSELQSRVPSQLKKFSWRQCGEETHAILKNIAKH